MKKILFILFLTGITSIASLDAQNMLTVKVSGIENKGGNLYAALYNSSPAFMKEAYQTDKIVVNKKTIEIVFDNLPNGEYALAIFHDYNNNDTLDRDVLNLPIERYGFSNNALPIAGLPQFNTCKFQVKENSTINVTLQKIQLNFQVK